MDLTQLANLGEFIGGVAVLVTLIYLAVQVREGRKDLRRQAEYNLAESSHAGTIQYALHPDLARSLEKSLTAPDSLNEEERRAAMWTVVSYFHGIEALYLRYLDGVVSPEAWAPQERIVTGLLRSPFTRRWWATKQNELLQRSLLLLCRREAREPAVLDAWQITTAAELEGG